MVGVLEDSLVFSEGLLFYNFLEFNLNNLFLEYFLLSYDEVVKNLGIFLM